MHKEHYLLMYVLIVLICSVDDVCFSLLFWILVKARAKVLYYLKLLQSSLNYVPGCDLK